MVYIINWRDVQPNIAHLSAVHWGGLRDRDGDDDPDPRNCLKRLQGFARHALQGRKNSGLPQARKPRTGVLHTLGEWPRAL